MVTGRLLLSAGPSPDLDRASRLFTRACELGDMEGCGLAATLLVDVPGRLDYARAAVLFTRACDGGHG